MKNFYSVMTANLTIGLSAGFAIFFGLFSINVMLSELKP